MKTVRLVVTGRVQGVWFRASAREEALRLGVSGWVRNLPDGDVEALVQGGEDAVDAFLVWCHHGPTGARVDRVRIDPEASNPRQDGFRIRY